MKRLRLRSKDRDGICLILTFVVIGAIAYALGWQPQFIQSGLGKTNQTPLEILKARYARGEISREEYEQMRQDLEGSAPKSSLGLNA